MLDKWDNKAPARTSKEIPIPLHPGETYAHYKHEFDLWLRKKKNESLESIRRKDPNYERTLWFCYALQRAGTTNRETAAIQSGSAKRPQSEAHSYYGPPPSDSKRQRTERPDSASQQPTTRSSENAPSGRAEFDMLAPKDKSAEAKTPEVKAPQAVKPSGSVENDNAPKDETLGNKLLEDKSPTAVKLSAESSSNQNEGPPKGETD